MGEFSQEERSSVPPECSDPRRLFGSAGESEAAYAKHVSASHTKALTRLDFLNIHYGAREKARVQDAYSGKWYWDCHRNGSKFNLGHRHPAVVSAMRNATESIDAGSFFQLSGYRARLAQALSASTGNHLCGVTFGVSGADAIEIAVHAARGHTGRRELVAIRDVSYHGATDLCLSLSGHSSGMRDRYLVDGSRVKFVPYNDIEAMREAVDHETAAVVMEPSPAQGGFPEPAPDYLKQVKSICGAHGALMVIDDVQTGLGGSGAVWTHQLYDFVPDILCTGKGLGGGLYPISAALMRHEIWKSYTGGQFVPHESTYAGSDIGCAVALAVLEVTTDPAFIARVGELSERFRQGLRDLPYEVSQIGLCMGIRTDDPLGTVSKLAKNGVLAVPSVDDAVVPFRPVLTLDDEEADEIISLVQKALTGD